MLFTLEKDWVDKLEVLSKSPKSNAQNSFTFLTLKVLLHGKELEQEVLTRLYSMDGPLYQRRMILSRARAVYKYLKKNSCVPVSTSKSTVTYTYKQVVDCDMDSPLFNVSTAYNTIKAKSNV